MILASLAAAAALGQDVAGAPASGDDLVRVELLADRAAIQAGGTFRIGVRLAIERRWHVYWVNPGDSGFPTQARIRAPAGFRVGPLAFPGPERFDLPGDIVSYGYEGETLLIADVTAPDALDPRTPIAFEVECSWLACDEICLRGEGSDELALPVGDPRPANEPLFARYAPRLPRPWSTLAGAHTEWSGSEEAPALVIDVRGTAPAEFFPYASPTVVLERQSSQARGGDRRLRLELRFRKGDAPRSASGVLRLGAPGDESFFELAVPWPADASASHGGGPPAR